MLLTLRELNSAVANPAQDFPGALPKLVSHLLLKRSTKFKLMDVWEQSVRLYKKSEKMREQLVAEFGAIDEKTGEVKADRFGAAIFETKERRLEFERQWEEQLTAEITIPGLKLTLADLRPRDKSETEDPEASILDDFSAAELGKLKWLINYGYVSEVDEDADILDLEEKAVAVGG